MKDNMSQLSYTLSPADKHLLYDTSRLPAEFVKNLQILFERLDKKNEGFIKILDLEKHWGDEYNLDDSVSSSVIIKRLHEVAAKNTDYLSFPRFCSGVKDALLEVKVRKKRPVSFVNALDLSGINLNSADEIDDNLSASKHKPQVRRSATMRERGRVERVERRRRHEFGEMQRRSLEAFYDTDVQKEEVKDLLNYGLDMIEKLKCWYSRKSSQCYYNSQSSADGGTIYRERKKIEMMNKELENLIKIQTQKNGIKSWDVEMSNSEIIDEQKEKISQLESEKTLLIRELFQMKAQLKSPAAKKNFPLFS